MPNATLNWALNGPANGKTNVVETFQSELRTALRIGPTPRPTEAGGSRRFSERVERSGQELAWSTIALAAT